MLFHRYEVENWGTKQKRQHNSTGDGGWRRGGRGDGQWYRRSGTGVIIKVEVKAGSLGGT
jgi:hypothetical protein